MWGGTIGTDMDDGVVHVRVWVLCVGEYGESISDGAGGGGSGDEAAGGERLVDKAGL